MTASLHRNAQRLAIFASLLSLACKPGYRGTPAREQPLEDCSADTTYVQKRVFQPYCGGAGCHGAQDPAYNLDLVSPGVEARLVNRRAFACADQVLVRLDQPNDSFLLNKMTETPMCGDPMPIGIVMNEGAAACLQQWIRSLRISGDAPIPDASAPARPSDTRVSTPLDTRAVVDTRVTTTPPDTAAPDTRTPDGPSPDTATPVPDTAAPPMCTPPLALCGSTCVNTASDGSHCGACGKICAGGMVCNGGQCVCVAGRTLCGATCVDTATNSANCGACGTACLPGQACTGGMCQRRGGA